MSGWHKVIKSAVYLNTFAIFITTNTMSGITITITLYFTCSLFNCSHHTGPGSGRVNHGWASSFGHMAGTARSGLYDMK